MSPTDILEYSSQQGALVYFMTALIIVLLWAVKHLFTLYTDELKNGNKLSARMDAMTSEIRTSMDHIHNNFAAKNYDNLSRSLERLQERLNENQYDKI